MIVVTGNIGRPLVRVLADAGEQVTAVSRRAAEVPEGVRQVVADLADPASLEPALTGAKALFLLLSGDLRAVGANPAGLIAKAADAGVRRIVLLSTLGVATRPFGRTRIAMRELEDVLRESGLDWVICGRAGSTPTRCGGRNPFARGSSPRRSAAPGCRSSIRRTSARSRRLACGTTGTSAAYTS
ncbi:NAD(P)H-binding [Amycolatopsis rubida]|uniref:NAD(P)H-binding n=1 Tax=Amycolatopsis rubida TaxID=112413 RepID=A0A1I5I4B0_9PSEU|nr:NAD(P)H-binding [Amycolatopsis rubida]